MSFIVLTQEDSNVENKITDDPLVGETFGNLSEGLSLGQSQNISDNFGENPPTERQLGELDVTSVISPTRFIRAATTGLWNILIILPAYKLGVPPIVIGLLGSIFLIILIIGAWAIWKGVVD